MPRRRDGPDRPPENSQLLRKLVHLALHDDSTYPDEGAFGSFERPRSERHAFDLRRLLANSDPGEEDARFILAALREPGVDPNRAVVLVSECMAVQHLREPFWSQCVQGLASDPEPRVRVLAVRAEAYAREAAIADDSSEVRGAALQYDGWRRPAILRQALRDDDARVREQAAAYVLTLPEWREECARLSKDADDGVRTAAGTQFEAAIKAGR